MTFDIIIIIQPSDRQFKSHPHTRLTPPSLSHPQLDSTRLQAIPAELHACITPGSPHSLHRSCAPRSLDHPCLPPWLLPIASRLIPVQSPYIIAHLACKQSASKASKSGQCCTHRETHPLLGPADRATECLSRSSSPSTHARRRTHTPAHTRTLERTQIYTSPPHARRR